MTSAQAPVSDTPVSDAPDVNALSPDNLAQTLKKLNLTQSEYQKIVSHLGRQPNFTEIAMFSVLWSEHCCYKNSRHLLKKFPNKSPRVVAGPGENAGVVDVGDGIQIAFKIESHNHPTAVEPFQGATTGVGGILRDIFTMNARPIANLNSLRFGPQSDARNRYLFTGAVKGIAHYGNCVGVPTIAGECFFDESYSGNPLVNAMSIGVIYDSQITSAKVSGIGNPVLYVGNSTGRDGMGGASFASRELDEQSHQDRPAVQVGDPFSEKLLIEACLEAFATGCVVAAQDMGAAGLTSSSCEMAAKGGVGMRMDLDKVPAREPDMLAHEYLLSESQERMLFVLEKGKEQPVLDVFKKWHIAAEVIGEVTPADVQGVARIEIYRHGKKVVDLPARLLTDLAPSYDPGYTPEEPETIKARRNIDVTAELGDITLDQVPQQLADMMRSENIALPKGVYQQYDRHVQNCTVLSSENLTSGVIRLRDKHGNFSAKAIAATVDCNPRYVYLEPYSGSMSAVAESVRNLTAVGATPIAVTDNLNFGNPEKPEIYYQLYYSVEGIREACLHFETPVISGNVSLYNEHTGQPILPAPVIGMVGLIESDSPEAITPMSPSFKKAGDVVILLGRFKPALGGSEYLKLRTGKIEGTPPDVSLIHEKKVNQLVMTLIQNKQVNSVQDVSMGGLLPTLTEALFEQNSDAGKLGFRFHDFGSEFSQLASAFSLTQTRLDTLLFGETNGSYLLSCSPDRATQILQQAEALQLPAVILGTLTDSDSIVLDATHTISVLPLKTSWSQVL